MLGVRNYFFFPPFAAAAANESATAVESALAFSAIAAASAAPYVLNTSALQDLATSSGLSWVHSDTDKVRAVQAAIAATPQAIRVPREIKPVVLEDHGPLVLVETRKDLSQLKLPFDAAR